MLAYIKVDLNKCCHSHDESKLCIGNAIYRNLSEIGVYYEYNFILVFLHYDIILI